MRTIRWAAAALATAAVAALAPTSATAVAPGAFGSPTDVLTVVPSPYVASAVLPNGAVGVAWTDGAAVYLRIRKPGQPDFTPPTLAYNGPVSFPNPISGSPAQRPITLLALNATTFFMGWGECGATCRAVSVNIPSTAAAFPPVSVASGSTNVLSSAPPAFGVQANGSAAAAWLVNDPAGYGLMVNRRIGATGAWQGLSAASMAARTLIPLGYQVAVDSTGAISASWLFPGSQYYLMVRTRAGASAWGLPVQAGAVHGGAYTGADPLHSLSASGKGTVMAALDDLTGASNFPNDTTPIGVNVLTVAPGSNTWVLARSGVTGPGRYAKAPLVSTLPDGSAVVRFTDYSGQIGGSGGRAATTFVLQRRGAAGAWSSPAVLDSFASDSPIGYLEPARWSPTLLPDGTYATPLPTAAAGTPLVGPGVALVVRSGWTGTTSMVTRAAALASVFTIGGLIDATGRATLLYYDAASTHYQALTSVLVKPAPYAGPALSRTPKRNVAVACVVGWADATTGTTYRWLRNGRLIGGATTASYKPKAADVGKRLACRASAANSKGTSVVTSAARVVKA